MEAKKEVESQTSEIDLSWQSFVDTKVLLDNMPKEEQKDILEMFIHFFTEISQEMQLPDQIDDFFDIATFMSSYASILQDKLNKQLDLVMHHPKFSTFEGKVRGLNHLVANSELDESLKIKVLSVTDFELIKDLFRNDWDKSTLFNLIYEGEIGTYGGEAFNVMIYDKYFKSSTQDIELITRMSCIYGAAHCMGIAGLHPIMFNAENFLKFNQTRDLTKVLSSKIAWQSFRDHQDSRYHILTTPRTCARPPYSTENNPAEGIDYFETVDEDSPDDYCWMNTAYVLAVRMVQAFKEHGWSAPISGIENNAGVASDLSLHVFTDKHGELIVKCPTEVAITDRKEKELSDQGICVLCPCKGTNHAVFFSVPTCQRPIVYDNHNATANARLSAMAPYMLIASRFLHYIKSIVRTKIGSSMSALQIENMLQDWISSYVLHNQNAPLDMKSKMPLKEAKVTVSEVKGKPGIYVTSIHISPHYYLSEMSVSLSLVAELPAKKS